jgi:hypothetical protein
MYWLSSKVYVNDREANIFDEFLFRIAVDIFMRYFKDHNE